MPSSYPVEKQSLGTNVTLTTTAIPYKFDLPANAYMIGGVVSATASSSATIVKAYPYLDKAQSIVGAALTMHTLHTTNVVTLVSVSATASDGVAFQLFGAVGGVKAPLTAQVHPYGIQITVSTSAVTATPGTFSGEVVAAPASTR